MDVFWRPWTGERSGHKVEGKFVVLGNIVTLYVYQLEQDDKEIRVPAGTFVAEVGGARSFNHKGIDRAMLTAQAMGANAIRNAMKDFEELTGLKVTARHSRLMGEK